MLAQHPCLTAIRHSAIVARLAQQRSSPSLLLSKRQLATPTDSDNGSNNSQPPSQSPSPDPTSTQKPTSSTLSESFFNLTTPIQKKTDANQELFSMFNSILASKDSSKPIYTTSLRPNTLPPFDSSSPRPQSTGRLPVSALMTMNMEKPFIVNVQAGRNNTMCNFCDPDGQVLTWSSAGVAGLKKAARGSSDAGYQAVYALTERAMKVNVKKLSKIHASTDIVQGIQRGVHLKLKGFGPGRDQAFRALMAAGWNISRITDLTGIRHGGCRPRKARRL